jgi:hypothetical protein
MPLGERDEGAVASDVVYQYYSAGAMMEAACSISNSVFLAVRRLPQIKQLQLADFRDQWRKATSALTRGIRPARRHESVTATPA